MKVKYLTNNSGKSVEQIHRLLFKYVTQHLGEEIIFEIVDVGYEEKYNQLKECIKDCPIVGEIHRDSNDRFKEWNFKYNNILKDLI